MSSSTELVSFMTEQSNLQANGLEGVRSKITYYSGRYRNSGGPVQKLYVIWRREMIGKRGRRNLVPAKVFTRK